jgi:hypothetical protein
LNLGGAHWTFLIAYFKAGLKAMTMKQLLVREKYEKVINQIIP